ncbi:MAG: glycoside hydrolase family 16 protein [Bdellovibrionales bacterium]
MFYLRFVLGVVLAALIYVADTPLHSATASAKAEKWALVWSDEFDYTGKLDAQKWEYETDEGKWGNNESQHYTDSLRNSRVENGNLIIETHHEAPDVYTSARAHTKTNFKYGRFEIRAKFPSGNGTWPAIWMMGVKQNYGDSLWPDNGEVDIVEHVGREPDQLLASIYTKNFNWMNGNGLTKFINFPSTEEDFHVYSLEWSPEELRISVDGMPYNVFKNPHTTWGDWPFDQDMHLILNLALNSFGGDIDDAIFPQRMLVDYVRIYNLVP